MEELSALNQYITMSGGVPVFRGTDIPVKELFDFLKDSTLVDFLEEYPEVSREQADSIIELVVANDFL